MPHAPGISRRFLRFMSLINPNWFEKLTPRGKVYAIIAALLAVLIIILVIFWAFSGGKKDENPLINNIGVANGVNGVLTNLVTNQEGVVKNAEINTNQAGNALNKSVNRPSNSFDGNRANSRFCRDFPGDPSCNR